MKRGERRPKSESCVENEMSATVCAQCTYMQRSVDLFSQCIVWLQSLRSLQIANLVGSAFFVLNELAAGDKRTKALREARTHAPGQDAQDASVPCIAGAGADVCELIAKPAFECLHPRSVTKLRRTPLVA